MKVNYLKSTLKILIKTNLISTGIIIICIKINRYFNGKPNIF